MDADAGGSKSKSKSRGRPPSRNRAKAKSVRMLTKREKAKLRNEKVEAEPKVVIPPTINGCMPLRGDFDGACGKRTGVVQWALHARNDRCALLCIFTP